MTVISVADLPAGSITGPITTSMVPGYLIKLWRGQNRPALCATGTTGNPLRAAAMSRAAALAETHARALGEDDDPEAASEPRAAGAQDLAQGRGAGLAVDGDGIERREAPPEQRQPQDLALQDPDIGWEHLVEREGLPGRLVLAEDDRGTVRQVLGARHAETQPAALFEPPEVEMRPGLDDEAVARAVGQRPDDQGERREYAQRGHDPGVKHEGAQVQ